MLRPVRRRYLAYLILAVAPSVAAVGAGVVATQRARDATWSASWNWVGTVALNALQEDLVGMVDSLTTAAQPTQVDPRDPAWERVGGGETVSAMRPRDSGAEVMVLTPPAPGDPEGTLRYAGAPLPEAPLVVARAAGSRLSLYLNGRRVLTTGDSLGPDTLPRQTLVSLSAASEGLTLSGMAGALVALDRPVGLPPAVAVMVAPLAPAGPALPPPLLLVTGLLFLFAAAAGWIQLGAAQSEEGARRGRSMVLVSLVPVLTAVGFLVQTDRLFQEGARSASARNLTRALAVSSARGVVGSPERVRELTGFQATRVRDGRVEETTLSEPLAALAALPAPPPSFTSAGTLTTSEGPSLYVALRLPGGGFVVTTTRRPDDRIGAFRRTLLTIGGILGGWLLLAGWMVGVGTGVPAEPGQDPDTADRQTASA